MRRGGHLEGQTIGALEGVTVSDEERSWFLVLQHSYGYGIEDRERRVTGTSREATVAKYDVQYLNNGIKDRTTAFNPHLDPERCLVCTSTWSCPGQTLHSP